MAITRKEKTEYFRRMKYERGIVAWKSFKCAYCKKEGLKPLLVCEMHSFWGNPRKLKCLNCCSCKSPNHMPLIQEERDRTEEEMEKIGGVLAAT